TQLGVVSALACSTQVADGATVARVTLIDTTGQVFEQHIVAGRDTAEWASDCEDVRPQMKHRRATLFRSYPAEREHIRCEGHDYVSTLPLPAAGSIKSLTFTWVGTAGALALKKIRLLDEPSGQSYPITPASLALADSARWRLSQSTGQSDIYENLRAMPRAWLVHEVIGVTAEEALTTIRSSRLPDGRAFDPAQTALVEEPFTFKAERPVASADTAQVLKASGDVVEVQTDSSAASFLVMSDGYYPGWQATVDGAAARLWQTNYALRGVSLPPGQHIVRLEFKPRAFYQGAAVSAASLLTLAAFTLFQARRAHIRRRRALD
ncbi:MAG: YfhO family protein, partial [Acidobacteriota bacterium]|nr:YfhO family protein [Acidobacteriota bacterium]